MSAVSYSRSGSDSALSRGVIFIHSCPNAVAPHLEWALAKVLGTEVPMEWAPQPVTPGQLRSHIIWAGNQGMGARIASSLLAFRQVRYEVTEDPSTGHEGERFAATPELGLFRASIGAHGDIMVHEERLRSLLVQSSATGESVAEDIRRLIGQPWDEELEAFRITHSDSNIRVLHNVS
jgi:hypothetical protein